ncbi:MAG: ABC transporter permease [Rhizobacter sp.]|jgi:NitT/TauT family transport system permease protein
MSSTAPTRRLFEEVAPGHAPDPGQPVVGVTPTARTLRPPPVQAAPAAPAASPGWWRTRLPGQAMAAASLLGVIAFWHFATTLQWDFYIRFTNIPTPAQVLEAMVQVNGDGKFITNVAMSLRRIVIGFALATVLGVALGLVIGRYRVARGLLFPAMEALRPIPAIAWVPISIMLWPDNEVSIVFITFIGAFFPILLNTVSGVQAVDGVLLRAGQCLGAREPQLMWHVVLPGAAPQIFTGLAVGMGVAWVSLIAAEMISGQFGIGYFTWEAYSLIAYPEIVLGMITIGVLGLLCSGIIRVAGKSMMPWLSYAAPAGGAR